MFLRRIPCPRSREYPTKLRVVFELLRTHELVDQLIVPTERGQKSIFPGHKDTYVGLKPGVVCMVSGDETANYFISIGSLFIHHGYVGSICTASVVPLAHIDAPAVKKALADYHQKLSTDASSNVQRDISEFTHIDKAIIDKALTEYREKMGVATTAKLMSDVAKYEKILRDAISAQVQRDLPEYRQRLTAAAAAKVQRNLAEYRQKLITALTNLGKAEALSSLHTEAS